MAKITKRQYQQAMAELENRKAVLVADIARIIDNEIITEYEGLNDKHDAVAEIEGTIKDLDHAWNTRNWNAADWALRELIISNID